MLSTIIYFVEKPKLLLICVKNKFIAFRRFLIIFQEVYD